MCMFQASQSPRLHAPQSGAATSIGTFILQVGERDVRGETFDVKMADKKIVMHNGDAPAISYGGAVFDGNGVGKDMPS